MFLYQEFLYRPLFNLLVFFYNLTFSDIGLAIILLTLLIKLAFLSFTNKAIKAQRSLQELQPQLKALQEKYKDNKEEQAKQIMALYRANKVNPLSGCLPILIQLPILIALYQVFLKGLNPENLQLLYAWVSNPQAIDPIFIKWVNLAEPNKIFAVLAGASQFWQSKMMLPQKLSASPPKGSDEFMSQMISKQTLYFLPILTVVISWNLPAGLALYWTTSTLFTILHQYAIIRHKK